MVASADGEIHFQECKTESCSTAQKYSKSEAVVIAKKEARKPVILNREK
jgi:hypothetical protein